MCNILWMIFLLAKYQKTRDISLPVQVIENTYWIKWIEYPFKLTFQKYLLFIKHKSMYRKIFFYVYSIPTTKKKTQENKKRTRKRVVEKMFGKIRKKIHCPDFKVITWKSGKLVLHFIRWIQLFQTFSFYIRYFFNLIFLTVACNFI